MASHALSSRRRSRWVGRTTPGSPGPFFMPERGIRMARMTDVFRRTQHLTAYMTEQVDQETVLLEMHTGKPLSREEFLQLFARITAWYASHTDQEILDIWQQIDVDRQQPNPVHTPPPPARSKTGVVYLLKSGDYYKIGKSQDFPRRRIQLDTQLPEKSILLATIRAPDIQEEEHWWHTHFAEKRLNGEWFALDESDIKEFQSYAFPDPSPEFDER
jgi:hypothetical protein